MFKPSLFVLFVFYVHNSSCIADSLYGAGKMVWNLYLILDKISLENSTDVEKLEEIFSLGKVKNEEIKIEMNTIFNELDNIEKFMNLKKFSDLLKLSSSALRLHVCVEILEAHIANIDYIYEEFKKYMKEAYDNSEEALEELMKRIILDINGDITYIRNLVIGKSVLLLDYMNIVEAISGNSVHRRDELCDGPQLTSSILAQLFQMVVVAEMKTNFMLSLANIHRYGKHGWNEMDSFSEAQFKKNLASYVAVFLPNINATDALYFRACDPVNGTWIRNKNFYELEKTIQTTLSRYFPEQCQSTGCSDICSDKWKKLMPMEYDQRTTCSHTTADCADLGAIETCLLKSGPYKFQYMNSTKLGALGRNFECPKDNGEMLQNGDRWYTNYRACACDCYGDDNKISLSFMESNVQSNWVIIGLRFVRENGVLHIQPKEGKLEANGYISPVNQEWIPIPNDPKVHTIDKENRIFFLDDLRLLPSYALTGVSFIKQTRGSITGFALRIFGLPFNYASGRCLTNGNFGMTIYGPNTLTGPGIEYQKVPPNYAHVRYTPNPEVFKYVSLEKSELSADFGQSTLPFFDAVPIVTSPPSVLGGIGIFHKGADGDAGFISLRIFGIRYYKYLWGFQRHDIANGAVLFDS